MPSFIDWVALLLVNMTAGYVLLAAYVIRGLEEADQKRWSPAFGMVGTIAFIFGGIMVITWPLPGPYNIAYGEMSVLFGAIFLAASLSLALGWDLRAIAGYAFFAGLAAIVIGARIISLRLTLEPLLAGVGFILSGLAGVFARPTLVRMRGNKRFRIVAGLVLIATAAIWAVTVYPEYWMHMQAFHGWMPATMHVPNHY